MPRPDSPRLPGPDAPIGDDVRLVVCPACKGDSVFAKSNAYRPFCSRRCKDIDFGAWASEGFKLPAQPDPDASGAVDDGLQ